ncbi:MAG: hypothetical protein JSU70_06895 [Phycisphaerales bacterium]|nr:MAG: hypothetical protein JSU70_06895 [Phycisphaerales bacterium]
MKARKHLMQRVLFGLLLVFLSFFFYAVHYAVFRDAHHIFIYLVGDVAFVFIEVLLVTLIIHQVLSEREKRALLQKLKMVIGAFFSEAGTPLLKYFSGFDTNAERISKRLRVDDYWSPEHFTKMRSVLENHKYKIDCCAGDLQGLQSFLIGKRAFLLRLLENPNLLEHDDFTELLWGVFHLAEELSHRTKIRDLPDTDYGHLNVDVQRVYQLLVREWLSHMEHLKSEYPYLFSLAVRTNPFDPEASAEVK